MKKCFFHVISISFLKIILIVCLILLTTFGWIPNRSVHVRLTKEQEQVRAYLQGVVEMFSEEIGMRNYYYYDNLKRARDYIAQQFNSLGYDVEFQTYEIGGRDFTNVIAFQKKDHGAEYLVIGAHYDTCFNPGADDNASGVAGVLGLAKMFAQTEYANNIIFAAFVNEEAPFFNTDEMGSRVFVKSLADKELIVKAAVILEMIGYYSSDWFSQKYFVFMGPFYPNKGNFISIIGNFRSIRLLRNFVRSFRKNSDFPLRTLIVPGALPVTNFSDHLSFWQAGIPAVMVTDTAHMRNRHYHQMSDLPETLDFVSMTAVVYGLKNAAEDFIDMRMK